MTNTSNPEPRPTPSPERVLRYAGAVLGKGLLYALSFWAVYAFVYTPMYYAMHKGDDAASGEAQTKKQMETWEEQAQRTSEALRQNELMQKRYDALVTKWEQQNQRMDAILSAWERQSGARK